MALPSLLYLVHRIPYPPDKGDKIRSYHVLRYLRERYRVHLGTFVDDERDWRYVPELRKLCADVCAVRLDRARQRLRSLEALFRNEPMSVPYYRSTALEAWVRLKLHDEEVSRVVAFSSPMAQYASSNGRELRKVVDFVDVDSEKWRQYAERRAWPMSWIYRREGERLLDFERRVASSAHASLFVTADEADLFRRRTALDSGIAYIVNGVDSEYFSPLRVFDDPYGSRGPVVVFTGAMDYWANVDAVSWFAREVLVRVREWAGDARFVIVGARPTAEVERLRSLDGVEVTGSVPDVRPYLAYATLAVAPLRIARGIQNKVLEAMAMARPVVATPAAVEGLELPEELRRHVAGSAEEFAESVVALLRSREERERIGAANRSWVREHHDWSETLRPLEGIIESGVSHGRE